MSVALIAVIAIVILAALVVFYIVDPTDFKHIFNTSSPPNVKFYNVPSLSESEVKVGTTTILSVSARNLDNLQTFHNVTAIISVTQGANPDYYVEYPKITKLADVLTPGNFTKQDIALTAINLGGKDTPFTFKVEIQVNGTTTDSRELPLTIVPNQ